MTSKLSELIDDALARSGRNRNGLASLLGLSRATLWRKLNGGSLDVGFLRELASATDISYAVILRSALLDTGAIESVGELLEDLPMTVVAEVRADFYAEVTSARVFTDETAARQYADVADEISTDSAEWYLSCPVVAINPAAEDFAEIYTATWWNRSRGVTARLSRRVKRAVVDQFDEDGLASSFVVTRAATDDGEWVTRVCLDGTDEQWVRAAVAERVEQYAAEGVLASADLKAEGVGFYTPVVWDSPSPPPPRPSDGPTGITKEKLLAIARQMSSVPYQWGGGGSNSLGENDSESSVLYVRTRHEQR